MASLLLNLVNNLSEGLHGIKCKLGDYNKKFETCGIKYKYCDCFLEAGTFLMQPHPLTSFEMQKYYQNELKLNGVY